MERYLEVLNSLWSESMPMVDDPTEEVFTIVRELVEAGYLEGHDVSALGYKKAYSGLRITINGREYRDKLEKDLNPTPKDRLLSFLNNSWSIAIVLILGSMVIRLSKLQNAMKSLLPDT